jgi:hypothetical protein
MNQFSVPLVRRVTELIPAGTKDLAAVYSPWFGKSVVLLVAIRGCQIPMPCSIVSESIADVCIRIKYGWEMDVRKDLILAVEESDRCLGQPDKLVRRIDAIDEAEEEGVCISDISPLA